MSLKLASKLTLDALALFVILSVIVLVSGGVKAHAQTHSFGSRSFGHVGSGSFGFRGTARPQWGFQQYDFVYGGSYGSHLSPGWEYRRWESVPYGGLYSPLYWPHPWAYAYPSHRYPSYAYPFGPVPHRFVPWRYGHRYYGGWHSFRYGH